MVADALQDGLPLQSSALVTYRFYSLCLCSYIFLIGSTSIWCDRNVLIFFLQDPPLFAVTEMLVHMSVPTEYSSHAHFEEALLDQLIHSLLAIGLPFYPYLFVHPEQSTISSFFLPFMFCLFNCFFFLVH